MLSLLDIINRVVAAVFLIGFLSGCVEKNTDPSDPAAAFALAREPYDSEMFEMAIQRLGEFKSRFPYSKHAPDAELLIADSHFQLGQYAESAVNYELFVKLHPKHPKADFAQFRVGESFWSEAPEEIEREQEFALKAIAEWEKLIRLYPEGEYTEKAKNLLKKGQRRVAEHHEFIAKFYCKREIFHACAYRYLSLAEQFPQFPDLVRKSYLEASKAFDYLSRNRTNEEQADANLYYKTMTVDELKTKANTLRSKAQELSLQGTTSQN